MTALPGIGLVRGVSTEIEIGTAPTEISGLTPLNRPFPDWPGTQPHSAQVGTVLVP